MKKPILVLQYPDPHQGRTIALAATRSLKAFKAFKQAVLEEARLDLVDRDTDEILVINNQMELRRLEELLEKMIPNGEDECEG